MRKWMKYAGLALALYALMVLMIRFADGGTGWGTALPAALVATPLVLWAIWLRGRLMERARDWGRRRFRPWPEERLRR
jgi:hypothetical protein